MNAIAKTEKTTTPAEDFRNQWTKQENEVAVALPPHIPVERFMRVVMTAVGGNADLMTADRRSLFESAMKAAQDGLLPDGRDGALVIFNAKVKEDNKDVWIKKVQWMPMVGGILKKIRNSGELLSLSAYVVYENDEFQYTLGDEETIVHRPCLDSNRGDAKLVYAIAKTKDGGIYREIMTLKDVEKVRAVSKTGKFGPWADWWDEMAKKTVIRRLAKRLPMSSDLDDLIRRDDELYDFSGRRSDVDAQQNRIQARGSLSQLLRSGNETAQIGQQAKEGFQIEHQSEEPEAPASEPDTGEQGASEPSFTDADADTWVLKSVNMLIASAMVGGDMEIMRNQYRVVKQNAPEWVDLPTMGRVNTVSMFLAKVMDGEEEFDKARIANLSKLSAEQINDLPEVN
ncbi:recombination protein RecT [Ochrobactrum sp. P6BSIII]|uniref:recombinase RecT n=1 Tax=unclassified Ochrobactrum TaxID=239106 RepID=UPI00185448F0|nr:recombination protein RecT [Ochrobactrum sp. P6BSIII]